MMIQNTMQTLYPVAGFQIDGGKPCAMNALRLAATVGLVADRNEDPPGGHG